MPRERLREDDHDRERDLFLCHAWADRQGPARELFDALREAGVDVWFSEEDVLLGMSLARQLDRGISCSHVSVVLVTPAMLEALRRGGFADQELGALLGTGRVVPVLHGVHYEGLAGESPLLAARAGLSTAENSLAYAAEKIAHGLFADNCPARDARSSARRPGPVSSPSRQHARTASSTEHPDEGVPVGQVGLLAACVAALHDPNLSTTVLAGG